MTPGGPVPFLADRPVTGGHPVVVPLDREVDRAARPRPGQRLRLRPPRGQRLRLRPPRPTRVVRADPLCP